VGHKQRELGGSQAFSEEAPERTVALEQSETGLAGSGAICQCLNPAGSRLTQWLPLPDRAYVNVDKVRSSVISAGICEETVFRGYLQQQICSWTGNEFIGVLGQAVLFGLCHAYQGWKKMALIFVWGCVFGAVVWWRKGLRANMIAHAALDSLAAF
jgi:hypothetical protein